MGRPNNPWESLERALAHKHYLLVLKAARWLVQQSQYNADGNLSKEHMARLCSVPAQRVLLRLAPALQQVVRSPVDYPPGYMGERDKLDDTKIKLAADWLAKNPPQP